MIRRPAAHRGLAGLGYWIAVATLTAAVVVLVAFVLVVIAIPELERAGVIGSASATPSAASASPSASPVVNMGGAILPGDAQCSGCHATGTGTIGLTPIPAMGHPLEGWGKCTSCHAPERLAGTAPGHTGIHATECTICHKPGDLPAPLSRPHRANQNVACLSCHGSTAPLPADMTHRSETVCWLCHRLPTIEPPVPAHETAPGETDCRTCHGKGGLAGPLPSDHVDRPASLCLECHEVTLGATPAPTAPIVVWPAPSGTQWPLVWPTPSILPTPVVTPPASGPP